jgi:hypothetical protein
MEILFMNEAEKRSGKSKKDQRRPKEYNASDYSDPEKRDKRDRRAGDERRKS